MWRRRAGEGREIRQRTAGERREMRQRRAADWERDEAEKSRRRDRER